VNWPKRTPEGLAPLRQRNFALLFAARAVSSFGDRLTPIALAFAVLGLEGASASSLGIVLAAGSVPTVVFLLVGGVWGDRLPRRRVLVVSDLARAAIQAALAYLLLSGHADVWSIAVLNLGYGTAAAFFLPASQGLVPQTTERELLQEANALLGLSVNVVGIAAPAAAGVVVAGAGPGWAIALDATTFVGSAVLLGSMRLAALPPLRTRSFLADFRDGWRAFTERTWVWLGVMQFALFHLLALAPFWVLGPLVAERSLGGVGSWATILVGTAAGSLAGGMLALRWRPRRTLAAGWSLMALFGIQLALLAAAAPLVAIVVAAAVASASLTVANAFWFTALQRHVPPEALARVSSYDWFGSLLFLPLGYAAVGPVAGAIGADRVLVAAAAYAVVSALVVAALPAVRQVGADAGPEAPAQLA
jgi:MFS family permease